jgi:UDP-N-acetylglucosamine 4,6-dehydratase/5-epimerase
MSFKEKIILITGGTGSFGKAFLDRILKEDFKEVRIFSRDELKQYEMRNHYNDHRIKFMIGDIRDYTSILSACEQVDYIFHAAALKQVPTCEFFPFEAVKTNIIGTENVLNAAIEKQVSKVVCLSTDKAVYPVNAMGISKAMMEKIFIAKARMNLGKKTVICGTRYGNVMGSRGSVIPLFIEQIKNHQDITITNPNMTRYMMTLEEAVELVIYAFIHGKQGDIFIRKSPSARIDTLAVALKKIFQSDVHIKTIGTRHGEKLFESLMSDEEALIAKELDDYFVVPMDVRDLNYSLYFDEGIKESNVKSSYTSMTTKILNEKELIELLLKVNDVQKQI